MVAIPAQVRLVFGISLMMVILSPSLCFGRDNDHLQGLIEAAQRGAGQARIDLAKYYLQKGGEENQRQAAKLLRAVAVEEQEDFLMPAYLMLHDIREMIRSRYPEITDKEYEKADNSIGVALLGKGDIDKAIDALIEEAGCLSSSAQIRLSIMYQYDVKGYPYDDPRILRFYEETAQEGLPRSQFFLGHIYLNGWGVPKDEKKGQQFLELSDWKNREFKLPQVIPTE